jgi:hypothetical protein
LRPPIVLWAVPRSVSTAFERAMRARGDLHVLSEPFSVPYYGPDGRAGGRSELRARGRSPEAWHAVVAEVRAAAQRGIVFVKDMAYHVSPVLDADFAASFENTFIVRHPALALRSLHERLPDFTPEEAGYEDQHRLMRLALEASPGGEVVVVDGEELRRAPAAVMEGYCRRVGLTFRPDSLSWEPGLVPDWRRWREWHGEVAQSSGIRPPSDPGEATPPAGVDPALYEHCLEHYESMLELGRRRRAG